ncbi:MAG: hypothetical protein IJJ41_09955 [Clostridia bacterium]|nr:hypothetical protein [Clostridia bacterium]
MIEINEALGQVYKTLNDFCNLNEMEFRYDKSTMVSAALPVEQKGEDYYMYIDGKAGTAIVVYSAQENKIKLLGSGEQNAPIEDCKQLSLWLLEPSIHDEKDVKSIANDFLETMENNFATAKAKDLSKVKIPKAVSKNQAKSGAANYDAQTLCNRFVMLYPEYKNDLKQNLLDYDELLAADFAEKYIAPKMLEVLEGNDEKEQKKFFSMLNDVYEDGLNEVQDLIAVVIMSRMNNEEKYLAVADKYMSDYMRPTIHHINKLMAGSAGDRYREKMKNPPIYKPKKQKSGGLMTKLMGGGAQGLNNQ